MSSVELNRPTSQTASYQPIDVANANVQAAENEPANASHSVIVIPPPVVVAPPDPEALAAQRNNLRRGNLKRVAFAIACFAASLALMNVSNPPPILTFSAAAISLLLPITTQREEPSTRNLLRFALGVSMIWASIHGATQMHERGNDWLANAMLLPIIIGSVIALPRQSRN